MTGQPENALWSAVLRKAIEDYNRSDEDRDIIDNGGKHFTFMCLAAGVTPEWVRSNIHRGAIKRYDKEKR
jgi:hypothetical protein